MSVRHLRQVRAPGPGRGGCGAQSPGSLVAAVLAVSPAGLRVPGERSCDLLKGAEPAVARGGSGDIARGRGLSPPPSLPPPLQEDVLVRGAPGPGEPLQRAAPAAGARWPLGSPQPPGPDPAFPPPGRRRRGR